MPRAGSVIAAVAAASLVACGALIGLDMPTGEVGADADSADASRAPDTSTPTVEASTSPQADAEVLESGVYDPSFNGGSGLALQHRVTAILDVGDAGIVYTDDDVTSPFISLHWLDPSGAAGVTTTVARESEIEEATALSLVAGQIAVGGSYQPNTMQVGAFARVLDIAGPASAAAAGGFDIFSSYLSSGSPVGVVGIVPAGADVSTTLMLAFTGPASDPWFAQSSNGHDFTVNASGVPDAIVALPTSGLAAVVGRDGNHVFFGVLTSTADGIATDTAFNKGNLVQFSLSDPVTASGIALASDDTNVVIVALSDRSGLIGGTIDLTGNPSATILNSLFAAPASAPLRMFAFQRAPNGTYYAAGCLVPTVLADGGVPSPTPWIARLGRGLSPDLEYGDGGLLTFDQRPGDCVTAMTIDSASRPILVLAPYPSNGVDTSLIVRLTP